MYTVAITYAGIAADEIRSIDQICRIFVPKNSYVDSDVYENGYVNASSVRKYGKSVYATNVEGWGNVDRPEPYATTSIAFPVAFAQFKLAMISSTGSVEFDVEDYKEAFYYMTLGKQMADQGFTVTVTKIEPEEPENPEEPKVE